MRYPLIIAESHEQPAQLILRLFVPSELIYFQGHFPNEPILPGIVQVDWAIYYAQKYLRKQDVDLATLGHNIEQLKFTKVIRPATELSLLLQLQHKNNNAITLMFKFFNDATIYSQGKIKV